MKKLMSIVLSLMLVCAMGMPVWASAETAEPLKVAIVVAGGLGDRSFYDSANEGLQQLAKDKGVIPTVVECKDDGSMFSAQLINAAESNDIVVAVGWQFWDGLTELAPQMEETKFIFVDNGLEGIANVLSIVYAQNEGSFLAGYAAAKLSKTGKIGAVGGEDMDTINDFIVGYEAGAKYANPDATVSVQYAGTFEDPAKGKENALALYSMGCDIVFQIAGKTGEGVFEAAAETGNLAIGVDGDQKYINPDVIVGSMIKKVGKSIYDAVCDYIDNGNFPGGDIILAGMDTGYIDISYGEEGMIQQISDELKAEIEALKGKIISGEVEVPTALK